MKPESVCLPVHIALLIVLQISQYFRRGPFWSTPLTLSRHPSRGRIASQPAQQQESSSEVLLEQVTRGQNVPTGILARDIGQHTVARVSDRLAPHTLPPRTDTAKWMGDDDVDMNASYDNARKIPAVRILQPLGDGRKGAGGGEWQAGKAGSSSACNTFFFLPLELFHRRVLFFSSPLFFPTLVSLCPLRPCE